MFVGHYAAGLALKKYDKRISLGTLFIAVQFVDIVFFPLVLLGIERLNIIPDFTQSTHFELEYMPYTHSLLAAFFWAGAAYCLFRWLVIKKHSAALVVALAVFSHWLLDLIVHTPDLPLWHDASPKFGWGVWNNALATYVIEALLLLFGLWLYLRATVALSPIGKVGMGVFVFVMLLLNGVNVYGPPISDSKTVLAVSALASYFLFAAIAYWLDKQRR